MKTEKKKVDVKDEPHTPRMDLKGADGGKQDSIATRPGEKGPGQIRGQVPKAILEKAHDWIEAKCRFQSAGGKVQDAELALRTTMKNAGVLEFTCRGDDGDEHSLFLDVVEKVKEQKASSSGGE